MKKILLAVLATFLLTACGSNNESDQLVVVTSPDYAPYEFLHPDKTGQEAFVGADIELAKYIADKLGKTLVIESLGFSDIPGAVGKGTYDLGISGFTYEPERAEVVLFSKGYDTSESSCQGFLVNKDKVDEYKSIEDFNKLDVAVQNGSVQQKYAEEFIPGANLSLVGQLNDGAMQLQTNAVDAVAISCAAGEGFVSGNPQFAVSPVVFDIQDIEGMMVISSKENQELIDEINKIIDEVIEQGLYKQWYADAIELRDELGIE